MRFSIPRPLMLATAAASLLLMSLTTQADYLWMEREASGVTKLKYGTLDGKRLHIAGVSAVQASLSDGKKLPMALDGDYLKVTPNRAGDIRVLANRVTPEGTLVLFQAKEGRSETKALNDLELVPTTPNGNTFKLIWKGEVVAIPQVKLTTSELGWNRVLLPDADGSVTLSTPFPATYVLELSAKLNGTTTLDDKVYKDVRHTATLSFTVPASK